MPKCGVRGYDMPCELPLGHSGKHLGYHVPGRMEPGTVWWDPKELLPIRNDDAQ